MPEEIALRFAARKVNPGAGKQVAQAGWSRHLVLRWIESVQENGVAEHISRKELKQDKIKETIEHGAEAVISHGQFAGIVVAIALAIAIGYGGWHLYIDRQTAQASVAFDEAMKAYQGRVGSPNPSDPGESTYADEKARSQDAFNKFKKVADKYPSTNPGKLARYYSALCLEDLERQNQALEELKKISGSSDKELAAMAQYQIAIVDARGGKTDEAAKLLRALADKPTVLVPRPLVQLELAGVLRSSNPKEAATIYQQIKKEFPDSNIAEQADRGLESIAPKS
jgi:predicted negative regulator of RcsB-dependent stress response